MAKKWILFSSDFKPMEGGTAEFTFQIASIIYNKGFLDRVVTPVKQVETLDFSVSSPNSLARPFKSFLPDLIHKKIESISFRLFFFKSFFLIFRKRKKCNFLFCFVDDFFAYQLIKFCCKIKANFFVIFHGKEIMVFSNTAPSFLSLVAESSSGIIFNSSATKDLFHQYVGTMSGAKCVIWHPIIRFDYLDELSLEKIDSLSTLPENSFIFSSVCRLVKRKGLEFAIKAFLDLDLDGDFKDAYFLIAGEGEEQKRLQEIAENKKDRIIFIGSITDQQKKQLLLKSHVFLMPNYSVGNTDFEGFGISFIEAAYFGNIVIGGKSGGAIEAIELCPRGFLVETDIEDPIPLLSNLLRKIYRESKTNIENKSDSSPLREEYTHRLLSINLSLEQKIDSLIQLRYH